MVCFATPKALIVRLLNFIKSWNCPFATRLCACLDAGYFMSFIDLFYFETDRLGWIKYQNISIEMF